MYAVIFKAEINTLDISYTEMALHMRELAISKYGCSEFVSTTEGKYEISVSYWDNQEQIKAWKEDKEHLKAQDLGKNKWYKKYSVQVVKVIREYNESTYQNVQADT